MTDGPDVIDSGQSVRRIHRRGSPLCPQLECINRPAQLPQRGQEHAEALRLRFSEPVNLQIGTQLLTSGFKCCFSSRGLRLCLRSTKSRQVNMEAAVIYSETPRMVTHRTFTIIVSPTTNPTHTSSAHTVVYPTSIPEA